MYFNNFPLPIQIHDFPRHLSQFSIKFYPFNLPSFLLFPLQINTKRLCSLGIKKLLKIRGNRYKNPQSHLIEDVVGHVDGQEVEDKAVGGGQVEVLQPPGFHLAHQDGPA